MEYPWYYTPIKRDGLPCYVPYWMVGPLDVRLADGDAGDYRRDLEHEDGSEDVERWEDRNA